MVFWSSRRIRIVFQVSMSWPMVTSRGERNSMSASLKPPGLLASPTMPIIEPPWHDGKAQVALQRGVPARQRASARVVRGVVRQQRLTGGEGAAEERVEVVELQALVLVLLVPGACLVVPGDVGHGMGLEVRRAIGAVEHLADEAVLAPGEPEDVLEEAVEGCHAVVRLDERRLGPRDHAGDPLLRHELLVELPASQRGCHPAAHDPDEVEVGTVKRGTRSCLRGGEVEGAEAHAIDGGGHRRCSTPAPNPRAGHSGRVLGVRDAVDGEDVVGVEREAAERARQREAAGRQRGTRGATPARAPRSRPRRCG